MGVWEIDSGDAVLHLHAQHLAVPTALPDDLFCEKFDEEGRKLQLSRNLVPCRVFAA